jgi:hypothetical protein
MLTNELKELHRLATGRPDDDLGGMFLLNIVAHCDGNSADLLAKLFSVLKRVIDCELSFDDPVDDWRAVLPKWFVEACGPDLSREAAEEYLRQKGGEIGPLELWDVGGFVDQFRPEVRSWWWWHGFTSSPDSLIVQIVIEGFPFAWDALHFLLLAAGATAVEQPV